MKDTAIRQVRIIVFAKAPQPGFAKTRLIPAMGADAAAWLARQMFVHTVREALVANIGTVELCVTPAIDDPAWSGIRLPDDIEITVQGEGDLGERMARAARRNAEQGRSVLLVGTDCVEMSAALLRAASRKLRDYDAVIHCTADGGYALLGLTKFSPFLFNSIQWSSDVVACTTLSRIGQLGWSVHIGKMLHDVDEALDLHRLPAHWSKHAAA